MSSTLNYHCVAYADLEACNPFEMATFTAAVSGTGLPSGARVLDIGCGNGAVSVLLAETFDFDITAVELDPPMADLARARIAASPAADRIRLQQDRSGAVLAAIDPLDLIVATGTTDPAGNGQLDVAGIFPALAGHLVPGGWLLWGDLIWTAEPTPPVRQVFEQVNRFASLEQTAEAARGAGLEVVRTDVSSAATMQTFLENIDMAVRTWLDAHPDLPEADSIRTSADRVKMMFEFARAEVGFSLCLMRKPPI